MPGIAPQAHLWNYCYITNILRKAFNVCNPTSLHSLTFPTPLLSSPQPLNRELQYISPVLPELLGFYGNYSWLNELKSTTQIMRKLSKSIKRSLEPFSQLTHNPKRIKPSPRLELENDETNVSISILVTFSLLSNQPNGDKPEDRSVNELSQSSTHVTATFQGIPPVEWKKLITSPKSG